MNSREENSYVCCLDFVQEFGVFDARGWKASREFYLTRTVLYKVHIQPDALSPPPLPFYIFLFRFKYEKLQP